MNCQQETGSRCAGQPSTAPRQATAQASWQAGTPEDEWTNPREGSSHSLASARAPVVSASAPSRGLAAADSPVLLPAPRRDVPGEQ